MEKEVDGEAGEEKEERWGRESRPSSVRCTSGAAARPWMHHFQKDLEADRVGGKVNRENCENCKTWGWHLNRLCCYRCRSCRRQSDLETHHQKTHSRINWLNYYERKRNREIDRDGKGQSKGKRWHGKLTKPRQRSRRECPNASTAAADADDAAAALVRRICNLFLTVWRGLHCHSKGVLAGREACKIYLPWLLMPQSRASRGQTQRRRHLSLCCCCRCCCC